MTERRLAWFAAVVFSTILVGCGSTSTTTSQSGGPTPSTGSTNPTSTPAALTAQIALTGGVNATLDLNPAESNCQILPTGLLSATFDGVLPGTEAGFTILGSAGTHPFLAGSDAVSLNTNLDFWHTDTSGTVTITIAGNTATGMVTGVIAGYTGSGVDKNVNPVHVSASFSCPGTRSS